MAIQDWLKRQISGKTASGLHDLKTIQLDKHFLTAIRGSLSAGESFRVLISPGWRFRSIKKEIEMWPKSKMDVWEAEEKRNGKFLFCMFLVPSLMSMHFLALSSGYLMSYGISQDAIEIIYGPGN